MISLSTYKKRFPYMTLLIILSCLFTSLPELFMPASYTQIIGQFPNPDAWYLSTLPAFSHSLDIFAAHLTTNLLVIALFGGLIEVILGSAKFSLVTIFTFMSTTFLSYFHSSPGSITHGVSGLCFGYIMFFLFFVIIGLENKRYDLFKKPLFLFSIVLSIFCVFGLIILEVAVLNLRLFQNFGQTVHLMSYFAAMPFLIIWRKSFETNAMFLISNKELEKEHGSGKKAIIVLLTILGINLFSTVLVLVETSGDSFSYTVIPESDADVSVVKDKIHFHLSYKAIIDTEPNSNTSLTSNTEDAPVMSMNWINDQLIEIEFTRAFEKGERVSLRYWIKREVFSGIYVTEVIEAKYGEKLFG